MGIVCLISSSSLRKWLVNIWIMNQNKCIRGHFSSQLFINASYFWKNNKIVASYYRRNLCRWRRYMKKSVWHENIFTIILSLTKVDMWREDIIVSFNVYGSPLLKFNSFHAMSFHVIHFIGEKYLVVHV